MPGCGGEASTSPTVFEASSARCAFMKTSSCCIIRSNSYSAEQHVRQGECLASRQTLKEGATCTRRVCKQRSAAAGHVQASQGMVCPVGKGARWRWCWLQCGVLAGPRRSMSHAPPATFHDTGRGVCGRGIRGGPHHPFRRPSLGTSIHHHNERHIGAVFRVPHEGPPTIRELYTGYQHQVGRYLRVL